MNRSPTTVFLPSIIVMYFGQNLHKKHLLLIIGPILYKVKLHHIQLVLVWLTFISLHLIFYLLHGPFLNILP